MIYNAGNKFIRKKYWIKVRILDTLKYKSNWDRVGAWCRLQPSNGKFYYHYAGDHWWFQNEQDAIMFKLRWGEYLL